MQHFKEKLPKIGVVVVFERNATDHDKVKEMKLVITGLSDFFV